MASLCCHGNSDVNKTWIITNFHLYTVQLWLPFCVIFVYADVVNDQSGEVYSIKKTSQASLTEFIVLSSRINSSWYRVLLNFVSPQWLKDERRRSCTVFRAARRKKLKRLNDVIIFLRERTKAAETDYWLKFKLTNMSRIWLSVRENVWEILFWSGGFAGIWLYHQNM